MKKQRLLAVTFAALTFFACSEDKDDFFGYLNSTPAGCLQGTTSLPVMCTSAENFIDEIALGTFCNSVTGEWLPDGCPENYLTHCNNTIPPNINVVNYYYQANICPPN